jgi:hypothetical protein
MIAPRIFKLPNGVNKTPPYFRFPIDKGGTRTDHWTLVIAEGLSFRSLDRRIYHCKLQNEGGSLILKMALARRMGGGRNFSKKIRASLFNDLSNDPLLLDS